MTARTAVFSFLQAIATQRPKGVIGRGGTIRTGRSVPNSAARNALPARPVVLGRLSGDDEIGPAAILPDDRRGVPLRLDPVPGGPAAVCGGGPAIESRLQVGDPQAFALLRFKDRIRLVHHRFVSQAANMDRLANREGLDAGFADKSGETRSRVQQASRLLGAPQHDQNHLGHGPAPQ